MIRSRQSEQGQGARMFGAVGADLRLEHVASRSFESGLVQLEYRVPR